MLAYEMASEQSVRSKGLGGQMGPIDGGVYVCPLTGQALLMV